MIWFVILSREVVEAIGKEKKCKHTIRKHEINPFLSPPLKISLVHILIGMGERGWKVSILIGVNNLCKSQLKRGERYMNNMGVIFCMKR